MAAALRSALLALLLTLGAAPAQALKAYCEAEIQSQLAAPLTPQERSSLEYYRGFNQSESGRYSVGMQLVRSHLDGQQGGPKPDPSPVAACLIKAMADGSTEAPTAPHAQEAYALRLLAGAGVERNPALAVTYLERSARWGYPSAAMHLAKIYLDTKNVPGHKAKAIQWLELVAFIDEGKAVGGWSAGTEQPIELLLDLHIADKNFVAAEAAYRRARAHNYGKSMLAFHLKQIPGLKVRIEAEEAEAARLAELRRLEALERSRTTTKTCIRYRSGYERCS